MGKYVIIVNETSLRHPATCFSCETTQRSTHSTYLTWLPCNMAQRTSTVARKIKTIAWQCGHHVNGNTWMQPTWNWKRTAVNYINKQQKYNWEHKNQWWLSRDTSMSPYWKLILMLVTGKLPCFWLSGANLKHAVQFQFAKAQDARDAYIRLYVAFIYGGSTWRRHQATRRNAASIMIFLLTTGAQHIIKHVLCLVL